MGIDEQHKIMMSFSRFLICSAAWHGTAGHISNSNCCAGVPGCVLNKFRHHLQRRASSSRAPFSVSSSSKHHLGSQASRTSSGGGKFLPKLESSTSQQWGCEPFSHLVKIELREFGGCGRNLGLFPLLAISRENRRSGTSSIKMRAF